MSPKVINTGVMKLIPEIKKGPPITYCLYSVNGRCWHKYETNSVLIEPTLLVKDVSEDFGCSRVIPSEDKNLVTQVFMNKSRDLMHAGSVTDVACDLSFSELKI